jgi:hypothetical protein
MGLHGTKGGWGMNILDGDTGEELTVEQLQRLITALKGPLVIIWAHDAMPQGQLGLMRLSEFWRSDYARLYDVPEVWDRLVVAHPNDCDELTSGLKAVGVFYRTDRPSLGKGKDVTGNK